ncbi:MAG TPA: helix-hairpin-helix domain-containing protein [Chryseosolibacter sp.]
MKTLAIIFTFFTITVLAQDKETNFNRIADELVANESDEDEAVLESRYENLTLLLSNPLDLNKVTVEELRQLYFLSEHQIQQFVKYREEQGQLLSIYELQAVPDFDQHTINTLAPLVTVVDEGERINASLLGRIIDPGNAYLILRWDKTLETKKGFTNAADSLQRYVGSDHKFFTRLRSAIPFDYSIGFTFEKDAGEKFQWNPRKRKFAADYNSAHIQLINKGRLTNFILGDYQAQFGQGVVLGGAFGLGKSAETITTVRRPTIGFMPHTSAGESGFYRGVAATFQVNKNLKVSAFGSHIYRDATLNDTDAGSEINAFQYSGFHRNANEQRSERVTEEVVAGSVLQYSRKSFDAGVVVQHITFQHPIVKERNLYNQFTFTGTENLNGGIFYNYTVNNFCLFGETAKSVKGGLATVTGVIGSLTPSLDVSVLYRNYGESYYSFYANPFSENTQAQNEAGIYWGIKYKWNRRWMLSSYFDLFRFPWLGFRRYAPASGFEWLSRLTFQPSRKMSLFLQARQAHKPRNIAQETTQHQLANGRKTNLWASLTYAEGMLRMRTRIQYSTFSFDQKTSDGIVLLQGLGFEIGKLQLTAHYALFQTDDFDNRQYVYENDVYLAFSLPSYDGNGIRSMFMAQYSISKTISVYARFARTYYHDKEEIGSGLESITGNTKNDVKFQAVLRF